MPSFRRRSTGFSEQAALANFPWSCSASSPDGGNFLQVKTQLHYRGLEPYVYCRDWWRSVKIVKLISPKMVMSSAVKTGAVSIPKSTSPSSSTSSSPTESSFASNLSYRLLNSADVSGAFYTVGVELSAEHVVFFYAVQRATQYRGSVAPVTERSFVVPDESVMYFEAPRTVDQLNKESLTSLLDMADDAGCSRVLALVPKDAANLKDVIRSYAACGFSISRDSQSGVHVVLQYDI